jgi:putative FmdB family regulatory protein
MPTYEYACLQCKRHVEAQQRFSDEPLRECPYCGGPLRRVFHPVGVVLKGSGFYSTDNRGSRRGASEPKKETSADTAASTDTSSDKPAKESKEAKKAGTTSSESKSTGSKKSS